jgi:SAM-dependent methyltransferase
MPAARPAAQTCPACEAKAHALGTSLGTWVFACPRCDLWFLGADVRPNTERDNHWYAGLTGISNAELHDLANQMVRPYRRQLHHLGQLTTGRDLLDVGCGLGMFLHAATPAWNTFGLETSAHARTFAQERLGLCVQAILEDLPVQLFDVVRLSHVLEHIPEPGQFMAWASGLIKPGGVLAVIVPNRESIVYWVLNRLTRYVAASSELRTAIYPDMHVLGFSRRSLVRLVERSGTGLRTISVETVSMGDGRYYPLLYDGLLRVNRPSDVRRQSIVKYYAPLLLANVGNRFGLGDWIVAYFRKAL